MKLYSFLRQYLDSGSSTMLVACWYAFMLFLIFLGFAGEGADLRYANL